MVHYNSNNYYGIFNKGCAQICAPKNAIINYSILTAVYIILYKLNRHPRYKILDSTIYTSTKISNKIQHYIQQSNPNISEVLLIHFQKEVVTNTNNFSETQFPNFRKEKIYYIKNTTVVVLIGTRIYYFIKHNSSSDRCNFLVLVYSYVCYTTVVVLCIPSTEPKVYVQNIYLRYFIHFFELNCILLY